MNYPHNLEWFKNYTPGQTETPKNDEETNSTLFVHLFNFISVFHCFPFCNRNWFIYNIIGSTRDATCCHFQIKYIVHIQIYWICVIPQHTHTHCTQKQLILIAHAHMCIDCITASPLINLIFIWNSTNDQHMNSIWNVHLHHLMVVMFQAKVRVHRYTHTHNTNWIMIIIEEVSKDLSVNFHLFMPPRYPFLVYFSIYSIQYIHAIWTKTNATLKCFFSCVFFPFCTVPIQLKPGGSTFTAN